MKDIIQNIVYEPWPWWVGGPLIGLFVLALLLIERKQLGISSSFKYICAQISPWKFEYFKDITRARWQFFFVIGLIGGGVVIFYLVPSYEIAISDGATAELAAVGLQQNEGFVPFELYNFSPVPLIILLVGGFFLGFGARYANGCTAGHAIMGVSQFAPASIIATVCFFIGGLVATHFILPLIF